MSDGGWSIRDIAGFWGAALSTIIALAVLIPSRPRRTLLPGPYQGMDDGGLTIRILNLSRNMLLIGSARRVRLKGNGSHGVGIYNRSSPLHQIGANPSPLVFYVPGEGEVDIFVNSLQPGDSWLLVFWWRRDWLLPLRLPLFIKVSRELQDQINEGSAHLREPPRTSRGPAPR
jgi:hypothetical protein